MLHVNIPNPNLNQVVDQFFFTSRYPHFAAIPFTPLFRCISNSNINFEREREGWGDPFNADVKQDVPPVSHAGCQPNPESLVHHVGQIKL